MYIRTKYLGPTTNKGSRIQFALIDNDESKFRMEFSYHEEAPKDYDPSVSTAYSFLSGLEKQLLYMFEQYLVNLNSKLALTSSNLQWKFEEFNMNILNGIEVIFTFKRHSINLG